MAGRPAQPMPAWRLRLPGSWGNNVTASITELSRGRSQVPEDFERIASLGPEFDAEATRIEKLCRLAVVGLQRMHAGGGSFPHTMRLIGKGDAATLRPEGENLRYSINVAQGVALLPVAQQRQILGGLTADEAVPFLIERALRSGETGAVALAAWAAAEVSGLHVPELFDLLAGALADGKVIDTVPCAWSLTAALAGEGLGDTALVKALARKRLLTEQSTSGLFPHVNPRNANGWRSHVGSFADQIYAIQALGRLAARDDDWAASAAAESCAARIVQLQGASGQWWWHYDVRYGSIVEGYPVYSVHQHAMAPMGLLDLRDNGGTNYTAAVMKGVDWIDHHPETPAPVVSERHAMVWRKVGRREPRKLVRTASTVTSRLNRGLRMPAADLLFPAGAVDYECRPYEFGWMLYAWRSRTTLN